MAFLSLIACENGTGPLPNAAVACLSGLLEPAKGRPSAVVLPAEECRIASPFQPRILR